MGTADTFESRIAAALWESDGDDVLHWRYDVLRRAGYGLASAARLAQTHDVDLHVAVDLLARGCPRETALRILL
jgi:hypothetical protein